MKKPPTLSPHALKAKDLLNIMMKKKQWTNQEILSILLPKYTAYDKDGLYHKIRQVLNYLSKQGKIIRVGKGVYTLRV